MAETTPLDAAHEYMVEGGAGDAARLGFYATLAAAPLWLLLESAPEGDAIVPKLAQAGDGQVVLAFDSEERLAAFAQGIAPQAAMPGRVLVQMLAGQGIGLALNIGVASSETLLPPEILDWLAEFLAEAPEAHLDARPEELAAPDGLPQELLRALDARLARAGGLADCAYLAAVRYADGRRGHLLAIVGAAPEAERAIAGAMAEAVRFGGEGMPELDVAFFAPDDPVAARLEKVALRFDLPELAAAEPPSPAAPGSDPDRPPILR